MRVRVKIEAAGVFSPLIGLCRRLDTLDSSPLATVSWPTRTRGVGTDAHSNKHCSWARALYFDVEAGDSSRDLLRDTPPAPREAVRAAPCSPATQDSLRDDPCAQALRARRSCMGLLTDWCALPAAWALSPAPLNFERVVETVWGEGKIESSNVLAWSVVFPDHSRSSKSESGNETEIE